MRRDVRRPLRVIGTILIATGLLTLAWVVVVWRWQDPFTAIQTYISQRHLHASYDRRSVKFRQTLPPPAKDPSAAWREAAAAATRVRQDPEDRRPGRTAPHRPARSRYLRRRGDRSREPEEGPRPLHRLKPSRARPADLRRRASNDVPRPVRAYQRHPQRRLHDARGAVRDVRVPRSFATTSSRRTTLRSCENTGKEILRLQACHPRFFATHRYIVDAALVSFAPSRGRARSTRRQAAELQAARASAPSTSAFARVYSSPSRCPASASADSRSSSATTSDLVVHPWRRRRGPAATRRGGSAYASRFDRWIGTQFGSL